MGTLQATNTLIRFDVRSTGSDEILGTWPIKFYDKDAAKNNMASQVVERILRWQAWSSSSSSEEEAEFETDNTAETSTKTNANVPWRLSKDFIEQIVMNGGSSDRARGSIGNTRPAFSTPPVPTAKGWGAAEGLVTGGSAAEFCDGIADWWPDVSVVCVCVCVCECVGFRKCQSQKHTVPTCQVIKDAILCFGVSLYMRARHYFN